MTKYKWSIEQVFYSVLAVALMAAFCHLALACYYADSEIWLLTTSQQAFSNTFLSSVYYKWSFHAITYLFSHFAPTELGVYQWARTGWMIVALITQWIVAYTYSQFFNNKRLLLPIFIAVMTFTAFFNQGFRIRGDILSLFAHSVILLSLFKLKDRQIHWMHYAWLFLWNILLVLSTPKSLYFYIAQIAFGISVFTTGKGSKSFFLYVWTSHLLPVIALFGLAIISHVIPPYYMDLTTPIHGALDFYLKSFDSGLVNTRFFTVLDFAHVIKVGLRSFLHSIIFFIGLGIYLVNSFRQKKEGISSALNIYFGVMLLSVVLHNQKFPFFIGTYGIPLIAYTFCLFATRVETLFKAKTKYVWIVILSLFVVICNLDYQRNLRENNNYGQQLAITTFDNYTIKNPQLNFYDIIGLLPRKNTIFLFVGPGEVSRKQQLIDELDKINPDIILFTFKFEFLEPEIQEFLIQTRVSIEENVWVKGDFFSVSNTMDYFRKAVDFNGKKYWVIPHRPKNHIYDLPTRSSIKDQVLYLKDGLQMKRAEEADSFAVPVAYLDVVQTNVAPIGFLQQPYLLFRYDTNF